METVTREPTFYIKGVNYHEIDDATFLGDDPAGMTPAELREEIATINHKLDMDLQTLDDMKRRKVLERILQELTI